jgi:hypothetical protein
MRIFKVPPQASEGIAFLMKKYRDRPMDLADSPLVWLAAEIGVSAVLTYGPGRSLFTARPAVIASSCPFSKNQSPARPTSSPLANRAIALSRFSLS